MYYQVSWIPQATPHLIYYVNDNLSAEVLSQMPQALALALKEFLQSWVSPTPALRLRPIAVAFDKLEELLVSHRQVLLGLDVDRYTSNDGLNNHSILK
jgi:hypothetical protein